MTKADFERHLASLVNRARNGDQVAMANLVMIRRAAAKGSRKANMAMGILDVYIRDHPSIHGGLAVGGPSTTTSLALPPAPPVRLPRSAVGGMLGAAVGLALAGPAGMLLGALAGFLAGRER